MNRERSRGVHSTQSNQAHSPSITITLQGVNVKWILKPKSHLPAELHRYVLRFMQKHGVLQSREGRSLEDSNRFNALREELWREIGIYGKTYAPFQKKIKNFWRNQKAAASAKAGEAGDLHKQATSHSQIIDAIASERTNLSAIGELILKDLQHEDATPMRLLISTEEQLEDFKVMLRDFKTKWNIGDPSLAREKSPTYLSLQRQLKVTIVPYKPNFAVKAVNPELWTTRDGGG